MKANVCALKESECNVFYVERSSYFRRNGTFDPILKVAGFFLFYEMAYLSHVCYKPWIALSSKTENANEWYFTTRE